MIEVRHSADPTCVELAALAAMVLRCEAVADPPEGDDRSVRVLVDGRQVASVYVGSAARSPEWVSAMAARLGRCLADDGFGGQGGVPALHSSHGIDPGVAAAARAARRAIRARDRLRKAEAPDPEAFGEPVGRASVAADDRGGE